MALWASVEVSVIVWLTVEDLLVVVSFWASVEYGGVLCPAVNVNWPIWGSVEFPEALFFAVMWLRLIVGFVVCRPPVVDTVSTRSRSGARGAFTYAFEKGFLSCFGSSLIESI